MTVNVCEAEMDLNPTKKQNKNQPITQKGREKVKKKKKKKVAAMKKNHLNAQTYHIY